MKKLYTTLALAAAVAVGASAAPRAEKQNALSLENATELSVDLNYEAPATPAKVPAKAANPTNMDEFCGLYSGTFSGIFESNSGPGNPFGVKFTPGEGANEVIMTGLWSSYPVYGTIDFAAGTVTFPRQVLTDPYSGEPVMHPNYGKPIIFVRDDYNPASAAVDDSDKPVVFKMNNGVLESPVDPVVVGDKKYLGNVVGVKVEGMNAWYFGGYDLTAEKWDIPAFDLEGWTKAGTAKFKDCGWVLGMWTKCEEYAFQDVEVYTKKMIDEIDEEEHTYVALYQPYAWYNTYMSTIFQDWDGSGYENYGNNLGAIVIDVTFPECVMVVQNYYTGFCDGDYYWNWNKEYGEWLNGFYPEDIIELFNGDEYYGVSTYDAESGVVDIKNCVFGLDADPTAEFSWTSERSKFAVVQLNLDNSALDTVITDGNAPVEYFNLQGVRVADDAKGLVIRKQGSNVAKIVR